MAFYRRWSLILFALLMGGGPALAASHEERDYRNAVQAFNVHFYSLAESRLTNYLRSYNRSTNAPMAELLAAQSEFYQGNYPAAISRMTDPGNLAKARTAGMADSYVYWQAKAQFAHGDLEVAAQTFGLLTENYSSSPLVSDALVNAASAYEKLGRWTEVDKLLDDPNGLFQRAVQLGVTNEPISDGQLLRAESKYNQKDYAAATNILSLLKQVNLTPDQDWNRAYLLYRANLGLNNPAAALAATVNLIEIARSRQGELWATNLAESVTTYADVLEQQGRLDDATAVLQENITNSIIPAGQQQQMMLKLTDLAATQKNLTNAEMTLENFLAEFPDSPAAQFARLTLGELHLKDYNAQPSATNHLTLAQTYLDQFLAVSSAGPLAGKAFLDCGWCDWLWAEIAARTGDTNTVAEAYSESLTNFLAAAEPGRLPISADLAVARFKAGDAQFVLTDYAGAQTNYESVLAGFSTTPEITNSLASRALYQILRARLALRDTNGMDEVMRQLLGKFFLSAPAEHGMLLAGEAFSDFDFPAKARNIFSGFKVEHGDSPLMPDVAFAIGRTYEREQDWPAAVSNYEAWLKTYPNPNTDLWPQVAYARAWAVSQAGDEARAFNLFTNLIGRYTNSLTPLAHWWVGDHYFRLGTNFDLAEYEYQTIFQNFPTNDLAFKAQFMAGRAAMGRGDYPNAKTYFTDLLDANNTNCPEGLRDQARFGLCEALRSMSASETNNASLQEATIYLAQMYSRAETNIVRALAWCETGDLDSQMGALDLATNAYAQAFNSPAASQELREQALIRWGGILEKMAETAPDDARNALLDLAMGKYEAAFVPDTDVTADADANSEYWTKEAGTRILALNAKTGSLKGRDLELIINKMEGYFPQLKGSLEQKRLALKN